MKTPFGIRGGISLLEVLIGIFVLAFGLLGIAAIIPAGRITVAETAKADYCGSVGRAALREIRLRRMLYPAQTPSGDSLYWADPTGKSVAPQPPWPNNKTLVSFCVDPLLAAAARAAGDDGSSVSTFPFNDSTDQSNSNVPLPLPRVTFLPGTTPPSSSPGPVMFLSMAQRIFVCGNDLALDNFPGKFRPRRLYTYSAGRVQEYPPRGTDMGYAIAQADSGTPLLAETEGSYSWMFTVTPSWTQWGTNNLPMGDRQSYNVSVVVFQNRSLNLPGVDNPPAERVATVTNPILGPGMGGGSCTLGAAVDSWLNFNVGDWLMLCGSITQQGGGQLPVFVWYKIITADPTVNTDQNGNSTRSVSLAGPDWPSTGSPPQPVPATQAVLLTNVLGVYTNTMQVDLSATWSK